MGWFKRHVEADDEDEWGDDDRSLLEVDNDPEMLAAQAEVNAEPLTPRSPPPADPYWMPY